MSPDYKLSPNHYNGVKRNAVCVGIWGAGHAKRLRPSVPAQGTFKRFKYLK